MTAKQIYEDLKQRLISDYEKLAKAYVKKWGTYLDVAEYPTPTVHRPIVVLIRNIESRSAREYYVKSVNVGQDAFQISINEYWNTPNGRKVEEMGNNCAIIPLEYNLRCLWEITNAMKKKMGIERYRETYFTEYERLAYTVDSKMVAIMKRYGQKELTLELETPIVFHTNFNERTHCYYCGEERYIEVSSGGSVFYYWDKNTMEVRDQLRRTKIYINEFNLLSYIDLESILLKKIK